MGGQGKRQDRQGRDLKTNPLFNWEHEPWRMRVDLSYPNDILGKVSNGGSQTAGPRGGRRQSCLGTCRGTARNSCIRLITTPDLTQTTDCSSYHEGKRRGLMVKPW